MSERVNPSVLIVDDNAPAVEMLTRLFGTNGFNVFRAYNGQEALVIANDHIPDLILLDIMMPGISGYEVLSTLLQSDRTKHIPTIFLTAKDTPSDIEQGFNLGAVDYIPKPAEPRELLARAKSKIEAKRLRDELAKRTRDLEILFRVSNALNTELNVSEILKLVMLFILDLAPAQTVIVYYQTERERFVQYQSKEPHIKIDDATVSDLARIIAPQLSNADITRLDHIILGYQQGYAVAIRYDNQIIGVILILAHSGFTENHPPMIESIVKQATIALQNAEAYELKANYATELEKTVRKRTEELVSAQNLLVRSEKLASVGRLASAIAHEINNPLTPVVLNLELMVEDMQAGRPIDTMDVDILATYNSAQRIKRIVERVLQFTRKGREDQPIMQEVDLGTLIHNDVALVRHFFQQESINLVVEINDDLPHIYGNSDQLEQVFLNMMINAKDAMGRNGTLLIQVYEENNNVVIKFRDNGRGIPPEIMEKLFEPFTSTKGENGSGLGLFVSFEIIRTHNGLIDVVTEVGKGTEFTIQLPALH